MVNKQHLVIHGNTNSCIFISEANNIHLWNPNSQLEIYDGANHIFGVHHPWKNNDLSNHLKEVVKMSIAFLKN